MNRTWSMCLLGLVLALVAALAFFLAPAINGSRGTAERATHQLLGAAPGEKEASAEDASLETPRALQPSSAGASAAHLRRGLSEAGGADSSAGSRPLDPTAALSTPEAQAEMREFEAFVDSTILDIRREDAEGLRADLKRRRAALDETMLRMERKLELSAGQSARLRNSIWTRLDLEAEYLRRWESGASPASLGDLKAYDRGLHL